MPLRTHSARTDNPHNLTLAELRLEKIQNIPLANRSEILGLTRDDRYIDSVVSEDHVKEAFFEYLRSLNLIVNGKILTAPRNADHLVEAYLNVDGRIYVKGAVGSTGYLKYVIWENGTALGTGDYYYRNEFEFNQNWSFKTNRNYEIGIYFYPDSNSMFPVAVAKVDVFDEFQLIDEGRIRDIALDLGENM